MRNVSILTLSLILTLSNICVVNAGNHRNKTKRYAVSAKPVKKTEANNINNNIATEIKEANNNTEVTTVNITVDDATRPTINDTPSVISEYRSVSKTLKNDLDAKISTVQNYCSGIKSNIDTIFGLTVATTVSSALGTAVAADALVSGTIKENNDKKTEEIELSDEYYANKYDEWKKKLESIKQDLDDYNQKDNTSTSVLAQKAEEILQLDYLIDVRYSDKYDELKYVLQDYKDSFDTGRNSLIATKLNSITRATIADLETITLENFKSKTLQGLYEKKSKTFGNVRTGLMAGATVTSAVSTGTSIGSVLNASKLAEKMSDCNNALKDLKLAKSMAEADEFEPTKASVVKAGEILSVCTGYDESNIQSLKKLATANTIVSGIGTATAGAGTVTSFMANSDNVRHDNSDEGKKKEKNLNLASNILAGVTIGTSGTSTALSVLQASKAKKDSEMAGKCEKAL